MTFIEVTGLVIVIIIGVIALVEGVADPAVLLQFNVDGGADQRSSRSWRVSRSPSSR